MKRFKVNRLAMHQTWYDNNKKLLFLEAHTIMGELLAMCRERTAERDEARRKFCEMMSNNSRLEFTTPQWFAEEEDWDCYKEDDNG